MNGFSTGSVAQSLEYGYFVAKTGKHVDDLNFLVAYYEAATIWYNSINGNGLTTFQVPWLSEVFDTLNKPATKPSDWSAFEVWRSSL